MLAKILDRIVSSFTGRSVSVILTAGWVWIWMAIPAVAAADMYAGRPISLELENASLEHVLATLSEVTGYAFVVDAQTAAEGTLDQPVTVDYELIPWDQVLDEILSTSGLKWSLEGKVLWIHRPAHEPSGDHNFTGEAVNLRLRGAKLTDVLSNLSRVTGLRIDFDPGIETTVTVNLREIPWDQVLDLILRISGFGYTTEDNSISVFRVTDDKGMQLLMPSET